MTSRERISLALDHKEADRIGVHDSPWGTTEARWRKEGMDKSSTEYFGFEFRGFGGDTSFQLPSEVIEDTDEYVIATNADGAKMKNWKHTTSTPEMLDFTITSREIWEEYKPKMTMNESRVNWEGQLNANKACIEAGYFCTMNYGPGFTYICDVVGPERAMMAMMIEPDWIKDMFMANAQVCADMAEEMIGRGMVFDAGWIFDDLGFRDYQFFPPDAYRELLMPAHKLICDVFKGKGLYMILHTCGYNMEFIPMYIEAGFDCIQPLEVKAGNDMLKLKKDYGDVLTFMGGIDVRAMASENPEDIEKEISSKIPIMKKGGGYIYHSDHSVPDNVSFEQYCRTMELVAEHGKY